MIQYTTFMLAGQAIAVSTRTGTTGTPAYYYLFNDHLGSASMTVNRANGNVDQRQRYLPFGGTRTSLGGDLAERGYTGHLHNDGVGLIYTPEWVCAVLCAQFGAFCLGRYPHTRLCQPPSV